MHIDCPSCEAPEHRLVTHECEQDDCDWLVCRRCQCVFVWEEPDMHFIRQVRSP